MKKKFNSFKLTLDEEDQVNVLIIVVIGSILAGGIIAVIAN